MDSEDDDQVTGRKIKNSKGRGRGKASTGKKGRPSKNAKGRKIRPEAFLESDSDVKTNEDSSPGDKKETQESVCFESKGQDQFTHHRLITNSSSSPVNSSSADQLLKRLDENFCTIPSPPITFGSATGRLNVPLHENKPLSWSHRVNLLGEKASASIIHQCELCQKPILRYGRLIPCKHVFCFDCAGTLGQPATCARCKDRIVRIEKNQFPSVFMCSHEKCRRTYLSQRDLHAHVVHRHTKKSKTAISSSNATTLPSLDKQSSASSVSKSRSSLAASLEELSKQSTHHHRNHHGHHSSSYPPPSLHTIQWTAAVAASTSATLMKATASKGKGSSSVSAWPNLTANPFNRAFFP